MNKIDVFGSTGFIGSQFCEMYSDEVIRVSRECNIPDNKDVLYLISTTDNYNVYTDLHLDINTNLNKLMDVLENCKDKDLTFNFVSSWFVYGTYPYDSLFLPVSEIAHCYPSGFYSITKKCAEDLLISFCETFKLKYRILRLGNVYGKGDRGVSKKKNALQYLIEEIKQNKDINLYFGGDFWRDYIHVDDVCRAIKLCMDKAPVNEIINVSDGIGYKFKYLIEFVIKETKSTSKIGYMDQPEFHKLVQVKNMILNTQKLKNLGYKPEISIEEGLRSLL